jgi:hypothetical protein
LGAQLHIGFARRDPVPAHQYALGLLDHLPGLQCRLQLRRQFRLLLTLHHASDQQRGEVCEGEQGQLSLRRPRAPSLGHDGDHSDRILVVGQRAGQHRPDPAGDRGLPEGRPSGVAFQILDPDQFLGVESVDTRPFLVPDLQIFQMSEPFI